ncbi:hypothetical protein [endosymbiont GvMRE of Glomus versiforme]|uniref:hypothetical protein n=1 Tax=endosymbiont GvMRE of Glomus versiforme TaxID=2039283 RepID=UPI000EB8518F|nr:hypothetical protein [endosymbiont GvMRE of Glomus versiforme]RHZ37706.1 hypothetical protein GvMRE_I1g528 [endosymbiont GvMRE of Glomus versiforme]
MKKYVAWDYIEKIDHSEEDLICEECGAATKEAHIVENEETRERKQLCYNCVKYNDKYNWEWVYEEDNEEKK